MPLTTDFDILVKHKGKDQGRKEKRPLFFTVIHSVPKQVSDTSQSIGINEKTRKNGLMSGVILPSQIAHDRWLSSYDGILDAFVIFVCFFILSSFSFSWISAFILLIVCIYMFFHIFWWETSTEWDFIQTISHYINQTRKFYYAFFFGSFLIFSTFGYYLTHKYDVKHYIIQPFEFFKGAGNLLQKTNIFELNKKTESLEEVPRNRFTTAETYKTKENIIKEEKDENFIEEAAKIEKTTLSSFMNYLIMNLSFILFFYSVFKYSSAHFARKRIENLKGVDVELKTDLELNMEELKNMM